MSGLSSLLPSAPSPDAEGMTVIDGTRLDPAADRVTGESESSPNRMWAATLAVASLVGVISGSVTIVDKIALLREPTAGSFCDVSAQIGCTPVLLAWQSSVLGPPNALLGVIMFAILGTSGLVTATGGRMAAGYRQAMVGLAGFFAAFLTWYMAQVAFAIGSLCPFCTVCAGAVLVALLATVRLAADPDGTSFPRALNALVRGNTDVVVVIGWGVLIAAMLFAGIWIL